MPAINQLLQALGGAVQGSDRNSHNRWGREEPKFNQAGPNSIEEQADTRKAQPLGSYSDIDRSIRDRIDAVNSGRMTASEFVQSMPELGLGHLSEQEARDVFDNVMDKIGGAEAQPPPEAPGPPLPGGQQQQGPSQPGGLGQAQIQQQIQEINDRFQSGKIGRQGYQIAMDKLATQMTKISTGEMIQGGKVHVGRGRPTTEAERQAMREREARIRNNRTPAEREAFNAKQASERATADLARGSVRNTMSGRVTDVNLAKIGREGQQQITDPQIARMVAESGQITTPGGGPITKTDKAGNTVPRFGPGWNQLLGTIGRAPAPRLPQNIPTKAVPGNPGPALNEMLRALEAASPGENYPPPASKEEIRADSAKARAEASRANIEKYRADALSKRPPAEIKESGPKLPRGRPPTVGARISGMSAEDISMLLGDKLPPRGGGTGPLRGPPSSEYQRALYNRKLATDAYLKMQREGTWPESLPGPRDAPPPAPPMGSAEHFTRGGHDQGQNKLLEQLQGQPGAGPMPSQGPYANTAPGANKTAGDVSGSGIGELRQPPSRPLDANIKNFGYAGDAGMPETHQITGQPMPEPPGQAAGEMQEYLDAFKGLMENSGPPLTNTEAGANKLQLPQGRPPMAGQPGLGDILGTGEPPGPGQRSLRGLSDETKGVGSWKQRPDGTWEYVAPQSGTVGSIGQGAGSRGDSGFGAEAAGKNPVEFHPRPEGLPSPGQMPGGRATAPLQPQVPLPELQNPIQGALPPGSIQGPNAGNLSGSVQRFDSSGRPLPPTGQLPQLEGPRRTPTPPPQGAVPIEGAPPNSSILRGPPPNSNVVGALPPPEQPTPFRPGINDMVTPEGNIIEGRPGGAARPQGPMPGADTPGRFGGPPLPPAGPGLLGGAGQFAAGLGKALGRGLIDPLNMPFMMSGDQGPEPESPNPRWWLPEGQQGPPSTSLELRPDPFGRDRPAMPRGIPTGMEDAWDEANDPLLRNPPPLGPKPNNYDKIDVTPGSEEPPDQMPGQPITNDLLKQLGAPNLQPPTGPTTGQGSERPLPGAVPQRPSPFFPGPPAPGQANPPLRPFPGGSGIPAGMEGAYAGRDQALGEHDQSFLDRQRWLEGYTGGGGDYDVPPSGFQNGLQAGRQLWDALNAQPPLQGPADWGGGGGRLGDSTHPGNNEAFAGWDRQENQDYVETLSAIQRSLNQGNEIAPDVMKHLEGIGIGGQQVNQMRQQARELHDREGQLPGVQQQQQQRQQQLDQQQREQNRPGPLRPPEPRIPGSGPTMASASQSTLLDLLGQQGDLTHDPRWQLRNLDMNPERMPTFNNPAQPFGSPESPAPPQMPGQPPPPAMGAPTGPTGPGLSGGAPPSAPQPPSRPGSPPPPLPGVPGTGGGTDSIFKLPGSPTGPGDPRTGGGLIPSGPSGPMTAGPSGPAGGTPVPPPVLPPPTPGSPSGPTGATYYTGATAGGSYTGSGQPSSPQSPYTEPYPVLPPSPQPPAMQPPGVQPPIADPVPILNNRPPVNMEDNPFRVLTGNQTMMTGGSGPGIHSGNFYVTGPAGPPPYVPGMGNDPVGEFGGTASSSPLLEMLGARTGPSGGGPTGGRQSPSGPSLPGPTRPPPAYPSGGTASGPTGSFGFPSGPTGGLGSPPPPGGSLETVGTYQPPPLPGIPGVGNDLPTSFGSPTGPSLGIAGGPTGGGLTAGATASSTPNTGGGVSSHPPPPLPGLPPAGPPPIAGPGAPSGGSAGFSAGMSGSLSGPARMPSNFTPTGGPTESPFASPIQPSPEPPVGGPPSAGPGAPSGGTSAGPSGPWGQSGAFSGPTGEKRPPSSPGQPGESPFTSPFTPPTGQPPAGPTPTGEDINPGGGTAGAPAVPAGPETYPIRSGDFTGGATAAGLTGEYHPGSGVPTSLPPVHPTVPPPAMQQPEIMRASASPLSFLPNQREESAGGPGDNPIMAALAAAINATPGMEGLFFNPFLKLPYRVPGASGATGTGGTAGGGTGGGTGGGGTGGGGTGG